MINNDIFPPVPETSAEYWSDSKWANENFSEIVNEYPDLWVAIVNKKVVASGKIISDVRKKAREKTNRNHFPVFFAEKGVHVYFNKSRISNQI